jgi:signal transduction histidine kinase/ActR/RegA family two-component response regulator
LLFLPKLTLPGHWRRWFWLLGLCWCLPVWADTVSLTLNQAEFSLSGTSSVQNVALPDTWAQRGLPVRGSGRYVLHVQLQQLPTQPWILQFDRLAPRYRIHLNGHFIGSDASTSVEPPLLAPQPTSLQIAPDFLLLGDNKIDIEVSYGSLAGLSVARLGAASQLMPGYHRQQLVHQRLPLLLNVAGTALALFMLLIWWRRPSERILGGFGAFWAIASIRNVSYYINEMPLPVPLADWLYFASQVVGTVLLGRFAMALSGLWLRGYSLVLMVTGAVLLPLGVWATWINELGLARTLAYPVLMTLLLPALGMMVRSALKLHTGLQLALAAGLTLVVGSALHDYLYLRGVMPVTDGFWLPYMVPITLSVFAWTLIERMVDALHHEQMLNAELESRVEQRTLALQQANAAKSRFLASASHDLRQPVVAIGLMVGLLREQIRVPTLREMIDRVDEAVASMETLLAGLLDLSRLESGTVQPRRERVALQTLFDAIDAHEFEAARSKGLDLRFRPTRLAVLSDPLLLEQILRNLVSNALRYTDRGGVLVCARRRNGQVLLQVWDTGRGIPEEKQAAVFEEFVQLGNRARDSRLGLGLGLAIVRRATDLLGHPIRLRSRLARGTCFSIELPRTEAVRMVAVPVPLSGQPLTGRRILLVEDDSAAREALATRLEHWGAEVTACDGLISLRATLTTLAQSPHLLITDQRLPSGSGLSAIAHVRQHHPQTAALVVTGNTAPNELAVLAASGVPVLNKPFRSDVLLAAIYQLLELQTSTPA